MLKLYQFERTWNIPNLSPFCCKIETYLRMADIPYKINPTLPLTAPKGKLPYIEDDDIILGDSAFIILHLKAYYKNLDEQLNAANLALSLAMQRLLEEHLFWVALYSRWQYTDSNWQINKQAIFGGMPPVIRDIAAAYYRHKIKQQIHGHRMGRHTPEDIFSRGIHDIEALSACLQDKKYFFGDEPSTLDASAFGMLVNTLICPIESPLKQYALTKRNLTQYVERVMSDYYPELLTA